MRTSRLEAFSDAVLAIIITVMVLELRVPEGHDLSSFIHTTGHGLITYLLSFVYIGIYWNNHHHMFHLVRQVTGGILWANLALLFFLSLLPFTTAWMDHSRLAPTPLFVYGLNLLLAAAAYYVLQTVAIRREGPDSALQLAVGSDFKGKASPLCYLAGMFSAVLVDPHGRIGMWIALGFYAAVAVLWIVPDRRIDRVIHEQGLPD